MATSTDEVLFLLSGRRPLMMALDKQLHFAAGLLITISVGFFIAPLYGIAAAIFAGFMKDARDWGCYRGFDLKDMVTTWLGGLLGTLLMEATKWMF